MDIRIYSEPPPMGVPPVKHQIKRRVHIVQEYTGLPSKETCSPTEFTTNSLVYTVKKNSRRKLKRRVLMDFKGNY